MHRKTKTVMTMNKELHLRSDTTRTLSIKEERGTSRDVQSRRPDIIFLDEQAREAKIIDIVNPGDGQVKDKELEKKEKSQILRKNLGKL
ncbi:unnamed protein product [Porites lobata]|uniref:Uncharacterized protein n=1 Tax=Porites lobata TaxID=104759 RepID=A0ABN8PDC8_9CNID|nr:unnamed protein product [Porites lobata]